MRVFFSLLVVLFLGCAGKDVAKMSLAEQISTGDSFYENGEYSKAIPYYDAVVFQRIGSSTEQISFRLAQCYLKTQQYDLASLELKQILDDYPRFAKLNEVYFNLAVCYEHLALAPQYDQKQRYEEIETLKKFLSLYPYDANADKAKELLKQAYYQLTLKKYYNGYIYYKILDYSSAVMYFKEVLDELYGQRVEPMKMSLYYLCLIYLERGNRAEAESYSDDLSYYFPQSYEATEIKRKLAD